MYSADNLTTYHLLAGVVALGIALIPVWAAAIMASRVKRPCRCRHIDLGHGGKHTLLCNEHWPWERGWKR